MSLTSFDTVARNCKTPAFIYDLNKFRSNLIEFKKTFPEFRLFYSTKTNPLSCMLEEVNSQKHSFDAASTGEIKKLLELGVNPDNILFTHPIKLPRVITEAYSSGIRKYTFDSVDELRMLSEWCPDSLYIMRILPPSEGNFYEYSDKFGASPKDIEGILRVAISENINISGISFHIGSQNMELNVWKDILLYSKELFKRYKKSMPSLRVVNIGSGFPAKYQFEKCPSLNDFAKIIHRYIKYFPDDAEFWCEPGRVLVADCAQLVCSVVRNIQRTKNKWIFVDFGIYHGLIEILESRGKLTYKIEALKNEEPSCLYNVAGNTLDPDDTLATNIMLPKTLSCGDRVIIHDVGAYTSMFFTKYHSLPEPNYYFIDNLNKNLIKEDDNVYVATSVTLKPELGIYSKKSFNKGDLLFIVDGCTTPVRTKYSLQLDDEIHIEPSDKEGNHLWGHYLNHSCEGNVYVEPVPDQQHIRILARRDILPGEEISIDYASMEGELSQEVECLCSSPFCRGRIVGFKNLSALEKKKYLEEGILPKHLQKFMIIKERT